MCRECKVWMSPRAHTRTRTYTRARTHAHTEWKEEKDDEAVDVSARTHIHTHGGHTVVSRWCAVKEEVSKVTMRGLLKVRRREGGGRRSRSRRSRSQPFGCLACLACWGGEAVLPDKNSAAALFLFPEVSFL